MAHGGRRLMLKKLIVAAAVVGFLVAAAPAARAASEMDFVLVNGTGYQINEVYIGPSSSDDWGKNILKEVMPDKATLSVTFKPEADAVESWDLMVAWNDGSPNTYWRGLKLAQIHQITLKYNKSADETSAVIE
jgi:geranylgeranyl pyrophosphate synthase